MAVEDEREQEEQLIHVLPIHFEVRAKYPNLSRLDFSILRNCPNDVRQRINKCLTLDDSAPTDLFPAFIAFTQGHIPGKFNNKPGILHKIKYLVNHWEFGVRKYK